MSGMSKMREVHVKQNLCRITERKNVANIRSTLGSWAACCKWNPADHMKTSNDYTGYTPIHVQYILLIFKGQELDYCVLDIHHQCLF